MELPKRKPNRLQSYDYGQNGGYFITICTKNKGNVLCSVGATCGRPHLSPYGKVVDEEINKIADIYKGAVKVEKYVIMPNHIHMILMICSDEGGRPQVAPTISRVVQQFKGSITKQLGVSIWQKLFHDHVIRNEKSYLEIWQYIDTNPLKWALDTYYTE